MRDRRRHLAGISVAALLALAALPAAAIAAPGLAAAVPASPRRRRSRSSRRGRGRPKRAADRPTTPTPTATPTPSRRRRSSPACGAQLLRPLGRPRASTRPSLKDSNGDGIPDYVERVLAVAEHVHSVENDKLGWREPQERRHAAAAATARPTSTSPRSAAQLFGYAAPDRGQTARAHPLPRRLHGYLVLDNDYSAFEFPGTKPVHDLEVTLAHEYNHILQFGYDAYQDPWFAESTAVWMEDQVYNGINDYLRYVAPLGAPLRHAADHQLDQGVRLRGLERVAGPPLRAARSSARPGRRRSTPSPAGFAVAAYEAAIRAAGPSDFSHDFTRFAADVAEWRTGKGFRESHLYPDMPRQGTSAARAARR